VNQRFLVLLVNSEVIKMEISKKMQNAINEQINKELGSAYIYLSMAAYFDSKNLIGMGKWMKKQAEEEVEHAMKFYEYLNDRGGKVLLKKINEVKSEWRSALDAFMDAYEHEKFITESIHKLVDISDELNDKATHTFLHWFIDEQVEEEASASEIVEKLKMIKESKNGLLMVDKELGQRK
jgi:ferritin